MTEERSIRILDGVVRRPVKPWTPTIQSLLGHLHDRGLPVPEPHGFDREHEYVGLVPGDAGPDAWPHQATLDGVRSAGTLLRTIHDATADWRPPADAVWSVPHAGGTVICHGDPQPANMAWRDGSAVGLFDWDAARPGEPRDDIAYALLWLAPFEADPAELRRRGFTAVPDRRARIAAFLAGYGWHRPFEVLNQVLRRRVQAIDEVVWLGHRGHQPQAGWVADGWPARWRHQLDEIRTLGRDAES